MGKAIKRIVHTTVFQNGPNGGNPCPVVLDGDELTEDHGKRLAAAFGAETIIIDAPNGGDADFGLRYFVPKYEMEMCVHGTIAATTVLHRMGRLPESPARFNTLLGPITVQWQQQRDGLHVTVFQFPPELSDLIPSLEEVGSALRIAPDEVDVDQGPIVSVSTSRPKLMIPLMHREVLDGLEPDFDMLWNLCDRYATTGFYPFAKASGGLGRVYAARQFPKRAGYDEDPATGVAACALGSYLTMYVSRTSGWNVFDIYQGEAMGRPSLLNVGAFLESEQITKTSVSGKARILTEASYTLAQG